MDSSSGEPELVDHSTTMNGSLQAFTETPGNAVSTTDTSISPAAAAETAKGDPAEMRVELPPSLPSSPRSDTREAQPSVLSPIKSSLQRFQNLHSEVLSRLENATGKGKVEDFVPVKDNTTAPSLLKSLELGVGEVQVRKLTIYIYCLTKAAV